MQDTWFALQTRHQHEAKVTRTLENKGFLTFLPMFQTVRRWSDRKKAISLPLFPGYVFVSRIAGRQFEILGTYGVATIVSFSGVPAAISCEEMESIRRATSDATKVEPHPYLHAGDEISVRSGPLAGTSGILIRKKDSYRLVVRVEILGRAASVEIDSFDLDPAHTSMAWSESRVS